MSNFLLSTAPDGTEWFVNLDSLCDAMFYSRSRDGHKIMALSFNGRKTEEFDLDDANTPHLTELAEKVKVLLRNRANPPLVKCIKNEGHEQYFTVGEYYETCGTHGDQYVFVGLDNEYAVWGPKEYFT